jgi:hypothetical protein
MKPGFKRRQKQAEAASERRNRVAGEAKARKSSHESLRTRISIRPGQGLPGASLFPRSAARPSRISHLLSLHSLQPHASSIPPLRRLPSFAPAIRIFTQKSRSSLVARVGFALAVAAGAYIVHAASHPTHRSVVPVVVSGTARIRETPTGAQERWGNASVTLTLDGSLGALEPAAKDAVRSAFGAWVASGIALPPLTFDSSAERRGAVKDGVNVVLYGPITQPGHEHDLAVTIGYEDTATGEILEADTIFNSAYRFATLAGPSAESPREDSPEGCDDRYDLQNVATHEAGHFFGLGEDTEDARATMYFRSLPCQTHKRVLTDSDRAVMKALYAEPFPSAPGGCGGTETPGKPAGTGSAGVQATAAVASQSAALSTGTVQWLDGTYGAGCVARSGSWSVRVSGNATMDYPALSVVTSNTACVLSLTKIVADQSYTGSPSIAMTASYQGSASGFTPGDGGVSFYANAALSSSSFASGFTVTILYSDNAAGAAGALGANYVPVNATSATTNATSPNYTLDLAGGALSVVENGSFVVQSVSGNANLTDGTVTGEGYFVDQGVLGSAPTFAQLDAAYGAATPTTISGANPQVAAAAFGLVGVNLTTAAVRTIVIRHVVSGVAAYQTFQITFSHA